MMNLKTNIYIKQLIDYISIYEKNFKIYENFNDFFKIYNLDPNNFKINENLIFSGEAFVFIDKKSNIVYKCYYSLDFYELIKISRKYGIYNKSYEERHYIKYNKQFFNYDFSEIDKNMLVLYNKYFSEKLFNLNSKDIYSSSFLGILLSPLCIVYSQEYVEQICDSEYSELDKQLNKFIKKYNKNNIKFNKNEGTIPYKDLKYKNFILSNIILNDVHMGNVTLKNNKLFFYDINFI